MKPITAIILGAGQRGANVYGGYALNFPNELKIVGVAEPRADRRAAFAKEHGIPEGRCFAGWEDALRQDKFADCVFVCTQDRMHFEPVMQALEKGYDVLCEKPMSYDRTGADRNGRKGAADRARAVHLPCTALFSVLREAQGADRQRHDRAACLDSAY